MFARTTWLIDRLAQVGERWSDRWWDIVVTHPARVIVVCTAVVAGMGAYGLLTLKPVSNTVDRLMTEGDRDWEYVKEARRTFGSDDIVTFALAADDVFTPPVLAEERRVNDSVRRLESHRHGRSDNPIHDAMAISDFNTVQGTELGMRVVPVMDQPPTDQAGAELVRERALNDTVLVGGNVTPSCRVLSVDVYLKPAPRDEDSYDQDVAAGLEKLAAEVDSRGAARAYVNGACMFNLESSRYTQADMLIRMPLAALVMAFVLFCAFRSLPGVILPMLTPVGAILCTLGFISLTGAALTVTTGIVPVLILAIGTSSTMHVVAHHGLEGGANPREYVRVAMSRLAVPIFICAVTTIIGFLSLMTSRIITIKEMGLFATFGITVDFILSFSLIPALLVYRKTPVSRAGEATDAVWLERVLVTVTRFSIRRRWWVLAGTVVVTAVSVWGATRMRVESDYLKMLKYNDPLRSADRFLEKNFTGQKAFIVTIQGRGEKAFYEPELLRRLVRLHDYCMKEIVFHEQVRKVSSFADFVLMMNRASNGDNPDAYRIPDERDTVARFMLNHGHPEDMAPFITPDYSFGRVFIRCSISSSSDSDRFNRDLQKFCERNFAGVAEARAASMASCLATAQNSIAWGQVTSLTSSTISIAIVMLLMFRSLSYGLLAMPQNLVPFVMLFGVMGLTGVPLDVGTSVVASLGLGIAVDDTTHLLARYREEVRLDGDAYAAIERTMRVAGRPVTFTTVALMLGFLPPLLSDFVPVIYLGLFTSLGMFLAIVAELLMTPALLAIFRPGQRKTVPKG